MFNQRVVSLEEEFSILAFFGHSTVLGGLMDVGVPGRGEDDAVMVSNDTVLNYVSLQASEHGTACNSRPPRANCISNGVEVPV